MKWPWRDTLFLRLVLLLWGTLVLSHLVAFGVVTEWVLPLLRPELAAGTVPLREPPVVFPSLPPTPGVPGTQDGHGDHPGLPLVALMLDYAIRAVLMALAAWYGARWLSTPVRRLARAATALVPTLAAGNRPKALSETTGTQEVRATARAFNTLVTQLAHEFRRRELVLAAISHDLRTPLTRLRLRLELGQANTDLASCVDDIRAMDRLIGSTLDLFRPPGASAPMQTIHIDALVQAVVDDMREFDARVTLHEDADSEHLALADPELLRRVLANAIQNALRHGGNAQLAVQREAPDGIVITVEDSGPGIAPEHLERVFDPFFQAQQVDAASTGSGLGLYIARELMLRQQGDIRLSNRLQGGLRVELLLKAAPELAAQAQHA